MSDKVTIRGVDRNLWIDFVSKIKKERKNIGDVVTQLIKHYLKKR